MANTMQVIMKDNKFCVSEHKENYPKRYQLYPVNILRTRHPEMSNLSELQYKRLTSGCARALRLLNSGKGYKPNIRPPFPYVTLDQLIAEPGVKGCRKFRRLLEQADSHAQDPPYSAWGNALVDNTNLILEWEKIVGYIYASKLLPQTKDVLKGIIKNIFT